MEKDELFSILRRKVYENVELFPEINTPKPL